MNVPHSIFRYGFIAIVSTVLKKHSHENKIKYIESFDRHNFFHLIIKNMLVSSTES